MQDFFIWMGQVRVEYLFGGYFALIFLGVLTAILCKARSGFVAWWAAVSGGLFLLLLGKKSGDRTLALALALSAVAFGAAELLLLSAFALMRYARRRRARIEAAFRKAEFTLPNSGNEYLRKRLERAKEVEEERQETGVDLAYIRGLLVKLKSAALSTVEQMRLFELSKQITVYASKEGLTAEERVALGDCFSAVLALAAKHGV